ncbi:unnamed protein product [Camellia sinensis]
MAGTGHLISVHPEDLKFQLKSPTSENRSTEKKLTLLVSTICEAVSYDVGLTFELEKQSYCDLKVANNTEHYVAFKVKTTSPKKYFVRPNTGVIQPWDSSVIRVTLQAQREYPPGMQCKDKFLLQSTIVAPNSDVDELPQDTFNKDSGRTMEERRLRVVYLSPDAAVGNSEDEASKSSKQSFDNGSMRSSSSSDDNQALQRLKEERDTAVRQTQQLHQELEMLKRRNSQKSDPGFSFTFALFVALIGIMVVMAPAEVKREGDDYDIPNEADDIRLMNESRTEPYHGFEAGPSNEEPTNMNVEDGRADVKKEMVDDAHRNDMVGDVERVILEQKFDSVEDGEAFYNAYDKAKGFSIRKSRFNTNKEGKVVSSLWLCSREGQRLPKYLDRVAEKSRAPKALTRVGCKAKFRIRYDADAGEGGKYVMTHFVADHNHELAEQHCVMYLRSHRSLNSADKAQAMVMRNVGVKTSQIMDYMVNQSGSYENVGFIHSKSRADYAKFGDVLIFDSTYRTNAYKKPFVMLAGVTSHFRATIFACVLLANETSETYTWVLETFMEAMGRNGNGVGRGRGSPSPSPIPDGKKFPGPGPDPRRGPCHRPHPRPLTGIGI